MKYICLGYMDEEKWSSRTLRKQQEFIDECVAYDDVLRKSGHYSAGEALQSSSNAITLRFENGRVTMTDGPFAETKEQLGGILTLEADDLNHAIQLMSKHPSIRLGGCFEIRPAADASAMLEDSERRRAIAHERSTRYDRHQYAPKFNHRTKRSGYGISAAHRLGPDR